MERWIRKRRSALAFAIAFSMLMSAVLGMDARAAKKKISITKSAKVIAGKTVKIKLKNNANKVKWKVATGKKFVKIKKKSKKYVIVKGVKKGTAKVQAVIGKKKYTCTVKVSAKKKPSPAKPPKKTQIPKRTALPSPGGSSNIPQATNTPGVTASPGGNASSVPSETKNPGTPSPTPVGNASSAPQETENPVMPSPTSGGNASRAPEETKAPITTEAPSEIRTLVYDGSNGEEIRSELGSDTAQPGKVVVKDGVTTINVNAFVGCCAMVSISIPDSVTSVDTHSFFHCYNLAEIKVSDGNKMYDSRGDCNAIIRKSDDLLIAGCKNTIIPNSVKMISGQAFAGCAGLKSIDIPDSVNMIGTGAFLDCSNLASINVSDGVTTIYDYAFLGCSSLSSINIPDSVTEIGSGILSSCSGIAKITVSGGNKIYDSRDDCNAIIRSSDNELVAGCKSTIIPNSVTKIRDEAFSGCTGLISINIPNSVTEIGDYIEGTGVFSGCSNLTSITWKGITYKSIDDFTKAAYDFWSASSAY